MNDKKLAKQKERHVFANAGKEKLQPDPIIESENVRMRGTERFFLQFEGPLSHWNQNLLYIGLNGRIEGILFKFGV